VAASHGFVRNSRGKVSGPEDHRRDLNGFVCGVMRRRGGRSSLELERRQRELTKTKKRKEKKEFD